MLMRRKFGGNPLTDVKQVTRRTEAPPSDATRALSCPASTHTAKKNYIKQRRSFVHVFT